MKLSNYLKIWSNCTEWGYSLYVYFLFNLGFKPNRRDGSLEKKDWGQLHGDWNLMKPSNWIIKWLYVCTLKARWKNMWWSCIHSRWRNYQLLLTLVFALRHKNMLRNLMQLSFTNLFANILKCQLHTVSDVCSTDWPKKDSTNFESQNFEGP